MTLRFFADQCVPSSIVDTLGASGHEVLRLRDHLDPQSPDSEVIAKAQELDAILVSLNGDFADIVSYPPGEYKGIIALQVKNHPEVIPHILGRLDSHLERFPEMVSYAGKLLIVEPHRLRVRPVE